MNRAGGLVLGWVIVTVTPFAGYLAYRATCDLVRWGRDRADLRRVARHGL